MLYQSWARLSKLPGSLRAGPRGYTKWLPGRPPTRLGVAACPHGAGWTWGRTRRSARSRAAPCARCRGPQEKRASPKSPGVGARNLREPLTAAPPKIPSHHHPPSPLTPAPPKPLSHHFLPTPPRLAPQPALPQAAPPSPVPGPQPEFPRQRRVNAAAPLRQSGTQRRARAVRLGFGGGAALPGGTAASWGCPAAPGRVAAPLSPLHTVRWGLWPLGRASSASALKVVSCIQERSKFGEVHDLIQLLTD